MEIVGVEHGERGGLEVETIHVWYSPRRQVWFVERLDEDGHQIGLSHRCVDEDDVAACLAEWLRAHNEARLVAPQELTPAQRRILTRRAA